MNTRVNIREIISNLALRRKLFVEVIIATQAREGVVTTPEQAQAAYDKIQGERSKQVKKSWGAH